MRLFRFRVLVFSQQEPAPAAGFPCRPARRAFAVAGPPGSRYGTGRNVAAGFTLLELLLVVALLGMLALSAVALTDTADQQSRFEQTQARLELARRGVLHLGRTSSGEVLLSGFVVDLGRLPLSLSEMVQGVDRATGSPFPGFAPQAALFDPEPGPDGLNDGGEIPLSGPGLTLLKGYRGPYLPLAPGENAFRDAWGNFSPVPTEDELNYGWVLQSDLRSWQLTSLGSDGLPTDPATDPDVYRHDVSISLAQSQWMIDLAAVEVQVVNRTGQVFSIAGGRLRAALLVYEAGRWRRFTTDPANAQAAVTSLEASDPGATASFFGLADSTGQSWVPCGEHLLVLVEDPDQNPFTADDTPLVTNQQTGTAKVFATRVVLVPGTVVSKLVLELRNP